MVYTKIFQRSKASSYTQITALLFVCVRALCYSSGALDIALSEHSAKCNTTDNSD